MDFALEIFNKAHGVGAYSSVDSTMAVKLIVLLIESGVEDDKIQKIFQAAVDLAIDAANTGYREGSRDA